jgi:hypothetical protein
MRSKGLVLLECLIIGSLLPFFLVLAYDLSVFATIANSSIRGGGGDAILLLMISAITYCFACGISIPGLVYIFYVSNKRKEKIKTRITILTVTVAFVVLAPLMYALL